MRFNTPPIVAGAIYAREISGAYTEALCTAAKKTPTGLKGTFVTELGIFHYNEGSRDLAMWAMVRKPMCRKDSFVAGQDYQGEVPEKGTKLEPWAAE